MGYSENFDKNTYSCPMKCKYCKYWDNNNRSFLPSYDSNHVNVYISDSGIDPELGGCYLHNDKNRIYHYNDGCGSFTIADELKPSPSINNESYSSSSTSSSTYDSDSDYSDYDENPRSHRIQSNFLDWILTIIQVILFLSIPGLISVIIYFLLVEEFKVALLTGISFLADIIVLCIIEAIRFKN